MIKRIAYFVYGALSYLIFLGTFLYAVAFVGGFGVSNPLDGPSNGHVGSAVLIDSALLMVFALQHSIMARPWFKERWTRWVPWAVERSTYVLCASAALFLLIWQWRPIGIGVWQIDEPLARYGVWALFAAGWLIVLAATFMINHFDLFGLRQVWLPLMGKPYTPVNFRTPLPYRWIRHPLYFGFLLAFWMAPTMTMSHLLFAVATTAYILVAIQFEERDLLKEHGATYAKYRLSVPMLLPWRRRPKSMPHSPVV